MVAKITLIDGSIYYREYYPITLENLNTTDSVTWHKKYTSPVFLKVKFQSQYIL